MLTWLLGSVWLTMLSTAFFCRLSWAQRFLQYSPQSLAHWAAVSSAGSMEHLLWWMVGCERVFTSSFAVACVPVRNKHTSSPQPWILSDSTHTTYLTRSIFHPEIPIGGFDSILVINVMFLADLGNLVSRCFNISNKCTCEDFLCYTNNLGVQWLVSGKEVENI